MEPDRGSRDPGLPRRPEPSQLPAESHLTPAIIFREDAGAGPTLYKNYSERLSRIFGGLQIACGILVVAFSGSGMALLEHIQNSRRQYWGLIGMAVFGAMYVVAGGFAIHAANRRTRCPIVAAMVFCILAAVFGGSCLSTVLGRSVNFISQTLEQRTNITNVNSTVDGFFSTATPPDRSATTHAVNALIANEVFCNAFALVALVAAIWCSTLGCRVICCAKGPRESAYAQGQIVYLKPPTEEQRATLRGPADADPRAVVYIASEQDPTQPADTHKTEDGASSGKSPIYTGSKNGQPVGGKKQDDEEDLIDNIY